MESRTYFLRFSIVAAYILFLSSASHFNLSDARTKAKIWHPRRSGTKPNIGRSLKQLMKVFSHFDNSDSYDPSFHFSLPPFDSLATAPASEKSYPYFAYPPSTRAQPPVYRAKSPAYPPAYLPSSPNLQPTPPKQLVPSTPPKNIVPIPPVNGPPPAVLQPPPSPPSPPQHQPHQYTVWCVAKPSVPDSEIQPAMDYACGAGADCKPIQANGLCFVPNTLIAHASYAFNSYWQNTKLRGGTCDFGGIAMLVTVDPSYNECRFIFK